MALLPTLTYPNKSHRTVIRIPPHSSLLAEFFGIMLGDGGINNDWQANITLNSVKDENYSRYVRNLVEQLFALVPTSFTYKTRNAHRILINSISAVDFLVSQGLNKGDKLKQDLQIPKWILKKASFKISCVRGLIDTDGCLFIHKHIVAGKEYRNIGLNFCSYSPTLIFQVASIFEEFGLIPHITKRGRDIYLYRADAVSKYLKIFGTSNSRIDSVYKAWRGG
jgi:hypothetical protein